MPGKGNLPRRQLVSRSLATRAWIPLAIGSGLGIAFPASSVTTVPVVAVAVAEQTAPGTTLPFNQMFLARINDAGQVAFAAQIGTGTSAQRTESLWFWENGSLQLVAAEGDSAPGTGAEYARFAVHGLNDAGQMAFFANLAGSGVTTANDTAVFAGSAEDYALAVREGTLLAPGSELVTGAFTTELGDDGDVLQSVHLGASGNLFTPNAVVWGTPGAMTAVAVESPLSLGFTGPGQGYLGLASSSGVDDRMLQGPLAAPAEIWHEGDAFGPALPGATISTLDGTMSEAGGLFGAFLAGAGVTPSNEFAVVAWTESDGFAVLLREGDPAPGNPDLTISFADERRMVIGSGGHAAGLVLLAGVPSSEMGLFAGSLESGLAVALATGDSAPGIAGGVIQSFAEISNVTEEGRLVFSAWVQPAGGEDLLQALYALRPDGTIDLLLRTGDTIEWGESRVVDFFSFNSRSGTDLGGNRNDRALNDDGQLVLTISHGGRSGVYVLDAVVPEPGAVWLVACGLLVLGFGRARGMRS